MTSDAWTDKHNAYCLEQEFPASVRTLWQWLLEQAENSRCEIEFDLKDFNKWVEKTRGYPFDVKTLKYARDRLLNSKVVSHFKEFTWSIWQWVLKPINLLVEPIKPQRKNSQKSEEIPNLEAANPPEADMDALTTTTSLYNSNDLDLEQKAQLCADAGIIYEKNDRNFLSFFSMEQIKKAIAYFLFKRNDIDYPEGWFRHSLEHNYADQYLASIERNQHSAASRSP